MLNCKHFAIISCLLCLLLPITGCGKSESNGKKTTFVTIGTGGMSGVYYPAGGAMAKLVNAKRSEYGIKMSHESSGGSVANINAVMAGDMEFGIAQSDLQFQAWHGKGKWAEAGKQEDLRAVCSLHPEIVTLVAAEDAKIVTLLDVKGKRVNIGNAGSGQHQNALDVFKAAGINPAKDLTIETLKAAESPQALQNGQIDAFFYTVGHPSGAIKEATAGLRRKVRFVEIADMEKLLAEAPYYAATTVPVGLYPKAVNKKPVASIGMLTTVITSAKVSDDIVYALTKELFENLESFKKGHASFASLAKEGMLQGQTAPLHPGAIRYFKEAGLME
jgi:uncharacterized protein